MIDGIKIDINTISKVNLKSGRPLESEEPRDRLIKVLLSKSEEDILLKKIKELNTNKSQYIRDLILKELKI